MSDKFKDALSGLILIVVFALSRFLKIEISIVIRFATLFAVLYHSWILGKRLLPRSSGIVKTVFGSFLFFSVFSVGLTAWFYAGAPLGANADLWTLIGTMVICHLINLSVPDSNEDALPGSAEHWSVRRVILLGATLGVTLSAVVFVLVGALHASTTDSIRTPWPLLPAGTLAAVALAWIAVPLSSWLGRSRAIVAVQSGLAIFATTMIAPLVYRLGFGFDGFLHLAGERQILSTGFLHPKPFYYIGQYVFTTFLSRTSDLPVELVDRWLVPLAAAILIPFVAYVALGRQRPVSLFGLLLLPMMPFIATTPQSFAIILGICAILLALALKDDVAWPAPILVAVWSIAAHPLAGIPMTCIALALLCARGSDVRGVHIAKTIFSWIFVVAASASVPLAFVILGLLGNTPIRWDFSAIWNPGPWKELFVSLVPWRGNTFVVWPALASLWSSSLPLIALAASVGTIVLETTRRRMSFIILASSGVLLIISGTLLKTAGDFAFLIDYERGNYADRLFLLGTICFVIAAMPAFGWLVARARERASVFSFLLLAACGSIAAMQTYNALPRHDALVTGRGWSVSAADMEAAKTIDRDAGTEAYTVLANQSVSAAAVSQFGFKRYNADVFFYPIPTGGPLYEKFLDMTYKGPSRDTARDAARLGGSAIVYVVLNDYWWNAQQVGDSLSAIAQKEWTTGIGTIPGTSDRIYKFVFSTSTSL